MALRLRVSQLYNTPGDVQTKQCFFFFIYRVFCHHTSQKRCYSFIVRFLYIVSDRRSCDECQDFCQVDSPHARETLYAISPPVLVVRACDTTISAGNRPPVRRPAVVHDSLLAARPTGTPGRGMRRASAG